MFYDILAKFYDIIFPKNLTIYKFLDNYVINQPSNILDIACGTGQYSIAFAQKGHNVYGIDNNKNMIESAINKAQLASIIVTFDIFDMMQLNLYNIQIFDFIFCIGNSIAHIKSIDELNNFFTNIYNKLKVNGYFVVHIINYQNKNIFDKNFFPIISRENLQFIRWYEPSDNSGEIIFKAKLIHENKEYSISNILLMLDVKQIYNYLQMKFSKVELFGDYNYSPYDINSNSAIFVCQK